MNFNQQYTIINSIIPSGELYTRIDCPFCNHTNTLVIRRESSNLMWYCFHASCKAKGKHVGKMSMEQVYETVVKQKKETAKPFIIPKSFVSILSEKKCKEYLEKNNCLQAKEKAKASFMYDVKQHRIVFLIKEKEKVIGAIGRGLNSQIYPKWYIYGEKSYPFICGEGKVGVLVEDCASACAVSGIYAGIALMGTSLPDSYIPILQKKFKKIIVALDRDATTKSFDIANKLSYYIDNEVKILEDDLKYYNENKIKEMFNVC